MFRRFFLLSLGLLLFGGMPKPVYTQDNPVELFLATSRKPTRTMPAVKTAMRTRVVEVNWKYLDTLAEERITRFRVKLFDGMEYPLTLTHVERREADCYTLFGTVDGDPTSTVLFTRQKDALAMSIRAAGDVNVSLKNAGGGVFHVVQHDNSKFPPCGGGIPCGDQPPVETPPTRSIQATTRYNVLTVYTPLARAAAGGTNQIQAIAQQAVDLCNTAYANSGLDVVAVNAGTSEVTYDENGTYSNHLNRLSNPSDGVMDSVHSLRNLTQADLVSLLVTDGEYCGLAFLSPTNEANGFSVVTLGCAVDNISFPHELGHNMGCGHDSANGGGTYSYSYGWRFTVSGTQYRTVMAYAPGTRVAWFSNPSVSVGGVATGTATADNARTIRTTIGGIAIFRNDYFVDPMIGFDFFPGSSAFPVRTVARAIELAPDGVTTKIFVRQGNYNERPRITKKVSIRNWNNTGEARIGKP